MTQHAFFIDPRIAERAAAKPRSRKAAISAEGSKSAGTKSTGPRARRMSSKVFDCTSCGLSTDAKTPKMAECGKGGLGIVIVGEGIDARSDRSGRYMAGSEGDLLAAALRDLDVDLEVDCVRTAAIQCALPSKHKPANLTFWAKCCSNRLHEQIAAANPRLIIAMGLDATKAVLLNTTEIKLTGVNTRGSVMPSQRHKCWVGSTWSPAYVLKSEKTFTERKKIFTDDLAKALGMLDAKIPTPLDPKEFAALKGIHEALDYLESITEIDSPVSFDYETTGLSPYAPGEKILCVSFDTSTDGSERVWVPLEHKSAPWTPDQLEQIKTALRRFLASRTPKIIQNYAMEERWSAEILQTSINNLFNDTMLSEHVVDERKQVCSLGDQVFRAFGIEYKGMVENDNLVNATEEDLSTYSALDAGYTVCRSQAQQELFAQNPDLKQGSAFLIRTIPALVNLEKRGIAVDKKKAGEIKGSTGEDGKPRSGAEGAKADCEDFFKTHPYIAEFQKTTGREKFGPGSDTDFVDLFYKALKLKQPPWTTKAGAPPSDKDAVNFIIQENNDPELKAFCGKMLTWRQYETLITNFLNGFEKNTHGDGLMHPSFLVHTVESYRSSSEGPNFQNLPKRNEEQGEFRKIIIPHLGTIIGEIDASGSELVTAAMLTKDPVLTEQVNNRVDLHRYWASRLYQVREQDVTKSQRQLAKNKFVFPELYGSWYRTVARDLELEELHVKAVEHEFFTKYAGVKAWQDDLIKFYNRNGYVNMPMGFRRCAPLTRNQIFNSTIQGTSFHMLLEAIWRADCEMVRRKMKSGIEIEVHDSIVADMVESEVEEVCSILVKAMTEKQFEWCGIVKRGAEMSLGPNWGDMDEIDISSFL